MRNKLTIRFKNVTFWVIIILFLSAFTYLLSIYVEYRIGEFGYKKNLIEILKLISITLFTSGIIGLLSDLASKKAIENYFKKGINAAFSEREKMKILGIVDIFHDRWKSLELQKEIINDAKKEIYIIGTAMTSFIGQGLLEDLKNKYRSSKALKITVILPKSSNPSICQRELLESTGDEDKSLRARISIANDMFSEIERNKRYSLMTLDVLPMYYFMIGNEKELLVAPYGYDVGGRFPVFYLSNSGEHCLYSQFKSDIFKLVDIIRNKETV